MKTTVFITQIDELIRPLGFKRKGVTWNRITGDFIDVLDVQVSKYGDTVTINAGVSHALIYTTVRGGELPSLLLEPDCIVNTRIGMLIDGKDLWLPIDEPNSIDEIKSLIKNILLPFFDQMHSFSKMSDFLMSRQVLTRKYPFPIIYLAVIKNELDDNAGALAILNELKSKQTTIWKNLINSVIERISFPNK
jgi:hypothetical protein